MLVSIKDQKKEFDRHVKSLALMVRPGNPVELMFEFYFNCGIDPVVDENYFYDFTLAFETFLYFNYHVDEKFFKYFDSKRFYA